MWTLIVIAGDGNLQEAVGFRFACSTRLPVMFLPPDIDIVALHRCPSKRDAVPGIVLCFGTENSRCQD